jgi:hypothetical protein
MKWTDEFLDAKRQLADPPADALVEKIVADYGPNKARELFSVLIRNIGIPIDGVPAYVQDYLDTFRVIPEWVDRNRVLKGQQVFKDHGAEMVLFLFYKSLPTCYLAWQGCETLAYTGRLNHSGGNYVGYSRRVGETTQFLLDVMAPDGLEGERKAIITTLKVRLIHASIRHFIKKDPDYQIAKWLEPINQEMLAFTLHTFSITMIHGFQRLGIPLSKEDAENYYYAWKVVGHFLGIMPEMLPDDVADAEAQHRQMLKRLVGSTATNKQLTAALIEFGRAIYPTLTLMGNNPAMLVRFFMGNEHADVLGVEDRKGCLGFVWPKLFQKVFRAEEKLEDKGMGLEAFMNKLAITHLKAVREKFNSVKGSRLDIREDFQHAWGL